MATYSFKLPDLGEGTVESEIVAWRVNVGAMVNADQALVDMMTDKATIEITAPISGRLIAVAGEPGDVIAVGAELAVFATGAEDATQSTATVVIDEAAAADDASSGTDASQQAAPGSGKPLTSPAIRRLAREHNIELSQVRGSGPNGRITRADIDAHLSQTRKPAVHTPEPETTGVRETKPSGTELQGTSRTLPPESVPDRFVDVRRTPAGGAPGKTHTIKLQGLRRRIAERMSLSASRIPHFSYVEEVDVTELERLRQHLTKQENQAKLTYLPFFMQALVKVMKEFPQCNAHYDDERRVITQFESLHIGIAVQTGDGLVVPVIRHVETLDLWQCAHELRQAADRAKNGRASREELSGSTITITSLGALGGIVSTPIINYPEVAIIGINKTQRRQVFENGGVTTRLVMNLSSSFDHRIVDGYDAARAIQALKSYLECPATLFI